MTKKKKSVTSITVKENTESEFLIERKHEDDVECELWG